MERALVSLCGTEKENSLAGESIEVRAITFVMGSLERLRYTLLSLVLQTYNRSHRRLMRTFERLLAISKASALGPPPSVPLGESGWAFEVRKLVSPCASPSPSISR